MQGGGQKNSNQLALPCKHQPTQGYKQQEKQSNNVKKTVAQAKMVGGLATMNLWHFHKKEVAEKRKTLQAEGRTK